MWPLKKRAPTLVTITLDKNITCSVLTRDTRTQKLICTYTQQFELPSLEVINGTLHNPTMLRTTICTFMQTTKTTDLPVMFGIGSAHTHEAYIMHTSAQAQPEDLASEQFKKLVWNYHLLSAAENNEYRYYLCGIERERLLQYQLLAVACNITCIGIIPQTIAQMRALEYTMPRASVQIPATNNSTVAHAVTQKLHQQSLNTLIQMPQAYECTYDTEIVTSIGLYQLGVEEYE